MYDACHDTDQNVLCRLAQSAHAGCLTTTVRTGNRFPTERVKVFLLSLIFHLASQEVSDTAQMHLLYTRFITVAGQLGPLLGEFERRARKHPEELGALLSECHTAYFGARKSLLVARLTEQIRGLDPTRTELVELVRFSFPRCVPEVGWSYGAA